MASVEQPEISLVLCTYGPEQPLQLLFESLRWQKCRYELLIVDQNSDDRIPRLIESYRDLPQTLLRSEPGLSRARNVGLRHVRGQVVAFPDDDCAYAKGALRKILDFFETAPDAGVLTGRTSMDAGILQKTCPPLSVARISGSLLLRNTASFSIFIDRRKLPRRTRWDFFDEKLGVGAPFGAAEETDYLYQLLRDGMKPYSASNELTYHPDKELEFSNFRRATDYGLGAGAFFRKNLTADPAFLQMAARAFIGPAFRALRSAILQERAATEYHARTLIARYQGFLTWPQSGQSDRKSLAGNM
jgi:glycosyltransferase involved in cell wall biosynthesis